VGAELDILCNEAGAMMGRLAGKKLVEVGGTERLGGQDRDGFEADGGRLKWVCVKGAGHGFTHNGELPDKIRGRRTRTRMRRSGLSGSGCSQVPSSQELATATDWTRNLVVRIRVGRYPMENWSVAISANKYRGG